MAARVVDGRWIELGIGGGVFFFFVSSLYVITTTTTTNNDKTKYNFNDEWVRRESLLVL